MINPTLYYLLVAFDIIFILMLFVFFFFNIKDVHINLIDNRLWLFYSRKSMDGIVSGAYKDQKYARMLIDFNKKL